MTQSHDEVLPAEPVGPLLSVLAALSDPVRLEMVRRMAGVAGPAPCSTLYDSIGKSTASHHFKLLREAGVTERSTVNGKTYQRLRYAEVEAVYPGVLRSIIESAG